MHKHVPLGGFWTPGFRCQVGRGTLYPLPEVFQLLEELRKKPLLTWLVTNLFIQGQYLNQLFNYSVIYF